MPSALHKTTHSRRRAGARRSVTCVALMGLLALAAACSSEIDDAEVGDSAITAQTPRNWSTRPAILEIDEADEIYALSDVHGGYVQLGRLLEKNGLISGFNADPDKAKSANWTGKKVILVVAGDVVDKGAQSLASIDFLRSLEAKAEKAGGRVIVTMGNHEAEFLDDPLNDKALATTDDGAGISVELKAKGIDPKDVAAGKDKEGRGAWLLGLPFGVRIKKWFFSHGGNTDGDTIKKLSRKLEEGVDSKDRYGHKNITGKDSILEAQEWWGDKKKAKEYADALGVKHMVFGHDPGALNDRGRIKAAADDVLVKVNVNMGLTHESKALVGGALLHVKIIKDAPDKAEALDASGTETPLF
jgi:hypothetical protein